MLTLWFRAVQSPKQAEEDLQRGYSYHQLEEYSDEELAEMEENDELEQLPNGDWVVPLNGICGFDCPEQALRFVQTTAFGPYIAVYTGRYAGCVYDGDLFKPKKLIEVIHKDDFKPDKYEEEE